MKQSRIREWEENNGLINFNWALIRRQKAREIKDTRQRDASYKFKSKLVLIRRNIQHFAGTEL